MTGSNGNYFATYSYLPFGQTLSTSGASANPFAYVGQWGVIGVGTGLEFMRARFYDNSIGRFLSNDPINLLGGSLNLLSYAQNMPTQDIDPSGLASINALSWYDNPANSWYGNPAIFEGPVVTVPSVPQAPEPPDWATLGEAVGGALIIIALVEATPVLLPYALYYGIPLFVGILASQNINNYFTYGPQGSGVTDYLKQFLGRATK
jgi:RHS repeat-associated protein